MTFQGDESLLPTAAHAMNELAFEEEPDEISLEEENDRPHVLINSDLMQSTSLL